MATGNNLAEACILEMPVSNVVRDMEDTGIFRSILQSRQTNTDPVPLCQNRFLLHPFQFTHLFDDNAT